MEGSCPTSQKLTLWSLYIQVMLILILINVHFLQNIISTFQEDSNCQNHSLSDSPPSHWENFPLKKHWGWDYIHTFKPSEGGDLFLSKYIISKSAIENNTTSKRKASSHCLPNHSAGGRRGKIV